MERKTVYLETSVISYLTNRVSRDLIVAGHQVSTREWWDSQRQAYEVYVSELVVLEASRGYEEAAQKRLALLDGIELLRITEEATQLAQALVTDHAIPEVAAADAVNIANAKRFEAIQTICLDNGYQPPILCTPDELPGDI